MNDLTPATDRPWVIAHRGASADRPENTLSAFDLAATLPIQAIELDLQYSAEGVPVVYHDRTLKKFGLPRKRISGRTWAELAKLDAGKWFDPRYSGERLTTLDVVLDRYAGRVPLMLEVKRRGAPPSFRKHVELVETILGMIHSRRLETRVYMLSFWPELLETAIDRQPGLRCVWNLEHPERHTSAVAERLQRMAGVCVNLRTLTREFVAFAHQCGRPVLSWAVNTLADARRAQELGVDGWISDRPGWLCGHLKEIGKR
ncbi:MAG: glycerophosphodiester phosphodiesterase [Nitrospirota bacterium]|nr:glycerophosphodiester phosphodiesterase [Nitrospirota bacterium]